MDKPFSIPTLPSFTTEELSARRRQRTVTQLDRARAERPGKRLFKAVSLSDWIGVAAAAGVPLVPAEEVCKIPVDVIMRSDEPQEGDGRHWQFLESARAALQAGEMMRWDCCASLDLKLAMQDGGQMQDEHSKRPDPLNAAVPAWRTVYSPDDPRFFDIAYEYPGDEMPVLKRPWVEAWQPGSHPIEYRVFVRNGEIEGVANYYLQQALANGSEVRDTVAKAIRSTRQILIHLEEQGQIPFNLGADLDRNGFDPDRVSCTLDFLVTPQLEVLFLEAGPPFGLGAHPCCFMENTQQVDGRECISVQGVCLTLAEAPFPLSDFEADERPALSKPTPR